MSIQTNTVPESYKSACLVPGSSHGLKQIQNESFRSSVKGVEDSPDDKLEVEELPDDDDDEPSYIDKALPEK